jgi:hypothetical protein
MMKHKTFQVGLSAIVVAGLVLGYWLRIGGENGAWLRPALYAFTPCVAALTAVYARIRYGGRGGYAGVLLPFAVALLFWAIGEVLWVYYENILMIDPFPSVADYFYIAAYPFFGISVFFGLKNAGISLKSIDPIVKFLSALVVLGGGFILGYFGVYLGYDSSAPVINNVISIGYSVGDFIILAVSLFTLILVWEFRGGNLMRFWLSVFAAFSMILVADIGFSIYNGIYSDGVTWIKNTLDSLWILGYLYFALSSGVLIASLEDARKKALKKFKIA